MLGLISLKYEISNPLGVSAICGVIPYLVKPSAKMLLKLFTSSGSNGGAFPNTS